MKRSLKIILESILQPILADNEPPKQNNIIKKDISKEIFFKILTEDTPRRRITESSPNLIRQIFTEEKSIKENKIKKRTANNRNFIRFKK